MDGTLTVVHGPFESLEEDFAARVALSRPGPGEAPLLVVAPSRLLADRLERLLALEKGLPLAGVHFHTFHSLAAAIVEEGGFPDRALVTDPAFHDAVVDRVLDKAPALGIARELRPRALASAVRSSLRDLLDAGVDPKAVAEHFGSELLEDPAEASRLNGLLALLAAYDRELEKLGVLAPSALVKRAAELAPGSKWLDAFREIHYYGAYDFTGLQLELFDAVTSARASRLYVPHLEGHPAYRFSEELFAQRLAGRKSVALPPRGETALEGALDALFDPSKPPRPVPEGRLRVISASGGLDEAWAAAKEAARLGAEGVPYADIVVSARSLEPYRLALERAFADEGVPLDLSCGEPILRQPLAKAALDLLTLRERDFPARVVEDLSGSPYFTAASPGRAHRWRRLMDGLGIRAGWLQWRGKLEPRAGAPVELRPDRVRDGHPGELIPAEDARSLWEFVSGLRERLGAPPASWPARAAEAKAIVEEHLQPRTDATEAERDAWEAVQGALEELAGFERLGDDCSWEQFLDAFERKLSRAARDAGDGRLGVRALDAMDLRGHRARALILIGLKEKLFPRQVAEDPLLRDAARAALRHPAGYWIGRKAAGHEEERLLFHLAVSSARERLTLIYPRSNEEGRPEVPSTYLRELCRAAGLPAPGEHDALRVPRQPAERLRSLPPDRLTPRESVLLAALDGGRPDAALFGADPGAEALDTSLIRAQELNAGGGPGARDGLTRPPLPELTSWKRFGLSPTAVDDYAGCPFKFFASRILGLGVGDEATERGELSRLARGKVYHAALERFYKTLGSERDWEPVFEGALAETFQESDWRALGLYPLLWEAARIEMSAHLRAFVEWDMARRKEFRPRLFEQNLLGAPADGAPGGVPWRGKADRVDADESGKRFRIVDYKTKAGARSKNLAKQAAEGEMHQLPFYAELAGPALGEGWTFAGAELLFLETEPDAPRSAELTAEDWAAARPHFLKTLAERVEGIASGRFPIRPEDGERGRCAWCEFPTVCRKAHGPSRARAAKA